MSMLSSSSSLDFFIFPARCDLIQPIKSWSRQGKTREGERKNNLLMSLWQARKIAFVRASEQHPAHVTHKNNKIKTSRRKGITKSYRNHAWLLSPLSASDLRWIYLGLLFFVLLIKIHKFSNFSYVDFHDSFSLSLPLCFLLVYNNKKSQINLKNIKEWYLWLSSVSSYEGSRRSNFLRKA